MKAEVAGRSGLVQKSATIQEKYLETLWDCPIETGAGRAILKVCEGQCLMTTPVKPKSDDISASVKKSVVVRAAVRKSTAASADPAKSGYIAKTAKYSIGSVVKHRVYPFRGVVFDIDPVFNNTEEWWNSIPEEVRPHRDQPFYHLFAENAETEYVAYVSEQNLVPDASNDPLRHSQISEVFVKTRDGRLKARDIAMH
jgi:heat shock protein HspQ